MNYRITVNVSQMENGWACTFQLPSFVYEGDVHGLTTAVQAQELAEKVYQQLLPNAGISASAFEVSE